MKRSFATCSFTLFLLLIGLTGCGDPEKLIKPETYPNTPEGNFEAFWQGINHGYVFFGYQPDQWDQLYRTYRPKVSSATTDEDLLAICKEMSHSLIDGHFTLTTQSSFFFPCAEQYPRQLTAQYFIQDLPERYLDAGYESSSAAGIVFGTITNQMQYVGIRNFNLSDQYTRESQVSRLLNFIQHPRAEHKGIIVDLRHNPGGNARDLSVFVGLFHAQQTLWGHLRNRVGSNRLEYGPWFPLLIHPPRQVNTLPCVVLCDRQTFSLGEITTMGLSLAPQVTVLGDTTAGGQGSISDENTNVGGSFQLPNGWKITLADLISRFSDGQVYEGQGFPPDITVPLDWNQLQNNGTDTQLEAALQQLR